MEAKLRSLSLLCGLVMICIGGCSAIPTAGGVKGASEDKPMLAESGARRGEDETWKRTQSEKLKRRASTEHLRSQLAMERAHSDDLRVRALMDKAMRMTGKINELRSQDASARLSLKEPNTVQMAWAGPHVVNEQLGGSRRSQQLADSSSWGGLEGDKWAKMSKKMVQGMRSYARSAAYAARPSVRRMEWYADRAADAVEPRALAVENYADNVAKEITPRIFDTENYANVAADSVSPSMLRMEGYAAEAAKAVVPDTRPALNSIGKWEEMLRKDEEDAVHAGIIAQKVASGEARRQAEKVGGGIAGVAREVGDEAARVSTGFGEDLSSAKRNVGQDAERVQNGIRAGMEGVRGEVGGLEGVVRTEAATSGEVQGLVARVKSVFASAERRALSQIEQYRGAA